MAGILIVFSAWFFHQRIETRPPAAAELSADEALRLGAKARGRMPEIPYVAKDLARVASFAATQRSNGEWGGLPPGAVLQVANTSVEGRDLWVNGLVQGGPGGE